MWGTWQLVSLVFDRRDWVYVATYRCMNEEQRTLKIFHSADTNIHSDEVPLFIRLDSAT
jgi:hypothetical protein